MSQKTRMSPISASVALVKAGSGESGNMEESDLPGSPTAPATSRKRSAAGPRTIKKIDRRTNISLVSPKPINFPYLSTRFTQYRNESAVSAYVLCNDVGKFRHFLLSCPVLNAFSVWKKEGGLNTDIEAALKLLDRTQPLDEVFPLEINAIVAKYGKKFDDNGESVEDFDFWDERETHTRQIHVLASILRYLILYAGKIITNTSREHACGFSSLQSMANAEFRKSTGRLIPALHDPTKVCKPCWGPFTRWGEVSLEAYNRAFMVMRRLMHVSSNADLWERELMQARSFDYQPVSREDAPFWMLSIDGSMGRLQNIFRETSPEIPPHTYVLRYASKVSKYSTLLERHAASLEADDYLELPDEFPVPCQPSPRDFETQDQLLNAVGAQLNFVKLGLQFHTVHLVLEENERIQLYPDTNDRSWSRTLNTLAGEPGAVFEYTLRPLGHDESSLKESQTFTSDMATRICGEEQEQKQRMEGFVGGLLANMSDDSGTDDRACGGDQEEVD